jgi:hypothetical protein
MNWQEHKFDISLDLGTTTLLVNDENLKPEWVQHPAKNTEFYLKRNKKNITIVIGESWTYGEALPNVASGAQKYDLNSQLIHCFGPKLALLLDSDLYQYAVPGNCNAYMFMELARILKYVDSLDYDQVNLFIQITDPSREAPIMYKLLDHPLQELYNENSSVTFEEWLSRYDDIFLTILEKEVAKYSNVNCVVWKNFCSFQQKLSYSRFVFLPESWIKFSARYLGKNLKMQRFQSVGWLYDFQKKFKNIKFSNKMLKEELDNIETSNNFIKDNYLHGNHPNLIAHSLWALNLYNFFNNEF